MLVVGLLLLAAAGVVGVAGISANTGSEHQLVGGFAFFGYHVHGSVGKLFLAGILLGAVAMLGFLMVAEGLRRNAALRRELFRFRRDAKAARKHAPVTTPDTVAPATAAPTSTERVLAGTAPTPPANTAGAGGSGGAGSGGGSGRLTGADTGVGARIPADRTIAARRPPQFPNASADRQPLAPLPRSGGSDAKPGS